MRTTADLRDAFALLEAEADEHLGAAPPPWSPGRPTAGPVGEHRGRMRVFVPLVSAAAVVLAVTGLAIVLRPAAHPPARPRVTAAAPAYQAMPLHELVFSVPSHVGTELGTEARHSYQTLSIDSPDNGHVNITFHAAGSPVPFVRSGAQSVRVNGRPGVYAVVDVGVDSPPSVHRGVAWQYGPDEWATVWSESYALSRRYAVSVAESVQPQRHPLLTPLRIRLPGATERDWLSGYPHVGEDDGGTAIVVLRDRAHVVQASLEAQAARRSTDRITIGGRTAYWSSHRTVLAVALGAHRSIEIMAISGGTSEALRVARATTATATPDRLGGWFDARRALP